MNQENDLENKHSKNNPKKTLENKKARKSQTLENKEIEFTLKSVSLNPEQTIIVTDKNTKNKHLLLACAGSGKTKTLTSRICYMINNLKCKPNEFVICTFNRNAADEMKKKINSLIGMTNINCGTFHSIGLKILNMYDYLYFDENIHIDETQHIFLDFLKSERSDEFRKNIKYIFVDEFQDVNEVQFNILKEISKTAEYIFFVGDDLQNIYTFRGSDHNYIMKLDEYFDDLKISKIVINYRNPPDVILLANEIQKRNKKNKSKIMKPVKASGKKPKIFKFKNLSQEIKFIVNSIKKDLENNYKKRDICVLCRNNHPLFFIEEQLQINNIKNKILNNDSIIKNYISLSTIHGAKGLEWKKVYLIGMNESYFPNQKSDIEEERRLFYVAVTRVKSSLTITFNESDKCSQLLTELDDDLFKKDFMFGEVNNVLSSLPKQIDESLTVTGIVKKLNGADYVKLKELKMFDNVIFNTHNIYEGDTYDYPMWVKQNNFFSEFGIFTDYLIRRMIADSKKNNDPTLAGLRDRRADEVMINVSLFSTEYDFYLEHIKKFDLLHRLNRNNKDTNVKGIQKLFKKIHKNVSKENVERFSLIFSQILALSRQFDVDSNQVNVTNKIFIPFQLQKEMTKHYAKYINENKKWNKIIWEIFMVSKCHSVWGDRRKTLYVDIKKENVLGLQDYFNDIYEYISSKIENSKLVLSNPKLNNGIIYGDADLIIDDEIMDFKTSNSESLNIEHTLQLLIYTSLARHQGMEINKISIFNPLKGTYKYCKVDTWNKDEELLDYLANTLM